MEKLSDKDLTALIKRLESRLVTLTSLSMDYQALLGIDFELRVIERELAEALVEAKNRGLI